MEQAKQQRISSRKMTAYWISSILGFAAFVLLSIKMDPTHLITLCQFYFGFQGLTTAGFFGGNFGEYWAMTKTKAEDEGK